jgi:hypothetical protein
LSHAGRIRFFSTWRNIQPKTGNIMPKTGNNEQHLNKDSNKGQKSSKFQLDMVAGGRFSKEPARWLAL